MCIPEKEVHLGHLISREGISTDPSKIDKVANWSEPTSTKEIQQFLGFTTTDVSFKALADAGFLEEGFYYNITRKACAKILKPRPLLIIITHTFDSFGEKLFALLVNRFKISTKVSHRSSFL